MKNSQDKRFRRLELKIGVFVTTALIACLGVGIFLGIEDDLFEKKYELHFTVSKGTGFATGMPVKLSGFRIGRVSSIVLNEQAQVDITVKIIKEYQKWIRTDSFARLTQESLVGDPIIEISSGDKGLPALKDQETITFKKSPSIEDHIDEITSKLNPVLTEVQEIMHYVNNPDGEIKKTLVNVQALSEGLSPTKNEIDHLLGQASKDVEMLVSKSATLLDQANQSFATVDAMIVSLEQTMTLLDEKIPAMLVKTDKTLENIEGLTATVDQIAADSAKHVPSLLENADQLTYKSDELLGATQQMWPFKNHINSEQQGRLINVDSYE